MVSLDLLSTLDGLIWLQSGERVANLFKQHQTTVSRNQKKCAQAFGITFSKSQSQWKIIGDSNLLKLERAVHQQARLAGKSQLRIEVNGWFKCPLFNPAPQNWIVGCSNISSNLHHIQCLKNQIIDACLCPLSNLPSEAQQVLEVIPLKQPEKSALVMLKKNVHQDKFQSLAKIFLQD